MALTNFGGLVYSAPGHERAEGDEAEPHAPAGLRPHQQLGVGTAIPSERQLSADLGVSRLTVRAALDDLAREGYLIRRRGSGTYVQHPKISQELTITSFSDDMRRRGMVPGSRTLSMTT